MSDGIRTSKESDDWLPCPFCGGADIRSTRHVGAGSGLHHRGEDVYTMCCYNCGATFPGRYRLELLRKAWNRRPTIETFDDLLCRIHRELARGHSSAALAVVAAALEHRALPVCTACDVVTLNQNALKALQQLPANGQCGAGMDGECNWPGCPQRRDGEPELTGRGCPLPWPQR